MRIWQLASNSQVFTASIPLCGSRHINADPGVGSQHIECPVVSLPISCGLPMTAELIKMPVRQNPVLDPKKGKGKIMTFERKDLEHVKSICLS